MSLHITHGKKHPFEMLGALAQFLRVEFAGRVGEVMKNCSALGENKAVIYKSGNFLKGIQFGVNLAPSFALAGVQRNSLIRNAGFFAKPNRAIVTHVTPEEGPLSL